MEVVKFAGDTIAGFMEDVAEIIEVDVEVKFVAKYIAPRWANRKMHVAAGGEQHIEQSHGIDRAAGAGDADNDGDVHGRYQ